MPKCQRILFVCLNDRGDGHPKGSCSRAGGEALLDRLRGDMAERGLRGVARAIGTRCLGQCRHAPVVNVQSEDVWYGGVQASDVPDLVERHVLGGEVLEHLEVPDEQLAGVEPLDFPLPKLKRP